MCVATQPINIIISFSFVISECCRRKLCNSGSGDVPIYANVNMENGKIINTWIDSLSASFPAVQVLGFSYFTQQKNCTYSITGLNNVLQPTLFNVGIVM